MRVGNNNSTFFQTVSSNNNDNKQVKNVEKSKVDSLKEAISNGTYKIDLDKTADKLAKTLL
ncbi:MAG: flagellar biosynthesis anti-sigma factor FlgM [Epsilonproteobacteria bacterium]|nr:flagellar biosynthesis anti-sigma factor FlgM [Campylobacterota bacterium]